MWNNLSITRRFTLVLCAFALSLLVVAAIGLAGLGSARNSLQTLHEDIMPRALVADQAIDNATLNRLEVLLAFQHAPENILSSIHNHPVAMHLGLIDERMQASGALYASLGQAISQPQEKGLFDAASAAHQAWVAQVQRAADAVKNGDYSPPVMAQFLEAGRNEGVASIKALSALRDYQVQEASAAFDAAQQRYDNALLTFLLAVLVLVIPSLFLAFLLLRRLGQGFGLANAATGHIASGNLTYRIPHTGKDEIGAMLEQMETMRLNLIDTVGRVMGGSAAISETSNHVANGAQDLAARTEQQASALTETASATEELSATVQHNAGHAAQARTLATEAVSAAQRGDAVVTDLVQTMEDINESSNRIVDIISVIDGIAFQTNILALNASVEAARAGEQGRGFAVVAGEVRSLAQRSAQAAREVQTLINESVGKIRAGHEQTDLAGSAMRDIRSGIERVTDIVEEIALASREQATGLEQINLAVSHLDGVTQQNTVLVEQTSTSASDLREQATVLAQLMQTFQLEAHYQPAGATRQAGSLRLESSDSQAA